MERLLELDATDLYASADAGLTEGVRRCQEIVFPALDLISGRAGSDHLLYAQLLKNGMSPGQLKWFQANRVALPLIGINLYPLFSRKVVVRIARGLRIKIP